MAAPLVRSGTIQSVDRALDILEALARAQEALPLVTLAGEVGLNPSTCHHLLATLAQRGYVVQEPRTRYYCLGNQVLQLQHARVQQIDLASLVGPILRELNRSTGEAVHLAVLQARELVTVAKLESLHPIKVDNGFVGKSNAAHATATGKAILAYLPEVELDEMIAARGLHPFTRRTITDPGVLMAELERVRQSGYAVDDEEFQPGVICVGAPVRNHAGQVVASISISAPQMRLTSQDGVDHLARQAVAAAGQISAQLGYTGS